MIDVLPVDLEDAKEAGGLLALTNTVDVVDALVALPGDQVLTSDPDDLLRLTRARGIGVVVVLF